MGAWGYGIFECDENLDVVGTISDEAGMYLLYPDDPTLNGKEIAYTTQTLDEGLFNELFNRYREGKVSAKFLDDEFVKSSGSNLFVVVLVALGMRLGVDVTDEQKVYTRSVVRSAGLFEQGVVQFEEALEKYKNGKPYEFLSLG